MYQVILLAVETFVREVLPVAIHFNQNREFFAFFADRFLLLYIPNEMVVHELV